MTPEEYNRLLMELEAQFPSATLSTTWSTKGTEVEYGGRDHGKTFKQLKALEIANRIMGNASQIGALISKMPRPGKSMRICKAHRRKQAAWREAVVVNQFARSLRIMAIASQPEPRYPVGGFIDCEIGTVGCMDRDSVIDPDTSKVFYHMSGAIDPEYWQRCVAGNWNDPEADAEERKTEQQLRDRKRNKEKDGHEDYEIK